MEKEKKFKTTDQAAKIFRLFKERGNGQKSPGLRLNVDTAVKDFSFPGLHPDRPAMAYYSPPLSDVLPAAYGPHGPGEHGPGNNETFSNTNRKSNEITSDIYRQNTETTVKEISMTMPGNKINHLADRVYDLILERVRRERAMRG
jgi:hypothetical protein